MATNHTAMPDRDTDTGQYVAEYPDSKFITAIRDLDRDAGTQAIADAVGCQYDTAYKKLTRLEKREQVKSRKIGSARLWEVADTDAEVPA